jgi:NAD(P)H-hydrate epimerase
MIPLLSREAVREVDRDAIERLGVPGLVLMENAGGHAARVLCERYAGRLDRVLIVGGVGQNGGDAWVVARCLHNLGCRPRCVILGTKSKVAGDAASNLRVLANLGVKVQEVSLDDAGAMAELCAGASVIVDGLFGTGLDRAVTAGYATAIEAINAARVPILALDLPSGIDANTGQVLGVAIKAEVTVTFAAWKRGLAQYPGVAHAGEVVCGSIGVPAQDDGSTGLLEEADLAAVLPRRAGDAHKGTAGHVLAVAGSAGKTGAAMLSALGALRAGAGLVTIAAGAEARRALDQKALEVMTAELGDSPEEDVLSLCAGKDAALVGPGLGLDERARRLARSAALTLPLPSVLDADALTAIGTDVARLRGAAAPRVLTPHPGEAARLLGCASSEVQRDRYSAAAQLAQSSTHVVVLKGARTVIASPQGELRVCAAGTPALGVAGTGDVLSGVIAAGLCTLRPFEAAWVGVMLHALAGELSASADRGLLASEVATAIPRVVQRCQSACAR